ncbi:hypothetical protein LTR05_000831 [Lithohypha guttulata]|uniref:Uncharacterized protein n=1 Tax=Lithohypha guttulata TaxID=1690604 RepID=A0AAN7TCT5_9EURO|nr:hypothetical protein LTR05_000831 [Lithohypha guttulata]
MFVNLQACDIGVQRILKVIVRSEQVLPNVHIYLIISRIIFTKTDTKLSMSGTSSSPHNDASANAITERTVMSTATTSSQTDLIGCPPEHYQILQTAKPPAKSNKKYIRRRKNKKESTRERNQEISEHFKAVQGNHIPTMTPDSDVDDMSSDASTRIITEKYDISTRSPLSTPTTSSFTSASLATKHTSVDFTNPTHPLTSFTSQEIFIDHDLKEAQKYLTGEQCKLEDRLRLCTDLRKKIEQVEAYDEQDGDNIQGPDLGKASLLRDIRILRAKWIANL